MNQNSGTVDDDVEHHRFLYREGGLDAQLVYRLDRNRLILVHTEVPDGLAGRGIGGRLVQAAVQRAEESGETLVPWCPYARKWLMDHSDAAGGVSIDWEEGASTVEPREGIERSPELPPETSDRR